MTAYCARLPRHSLMTWEKKMEQENEKVTAFGKWLRERRISRGLTMERLSEKAGTAPAVISNLERGERNPSRDMVRRLAQGLLNEGANEEFALFILNSGLTAAGFTSDSSEGDEHEVIDYLRGKPASQKDKALKSLKILFDDDDAIDNQGNIGKKAE